MLHGDGNVNSLCTLPCIEYNSVRFLKCSAAVLLSIWPSCYVSASYSLLDLYLAVVDVNFLNRGLIKVIVSYRNPRINLIKIELCGITLHLHMNGEYKI